MGSDRAAGIEGGGSILSAYDSRAEQSGGRAVKAKDVATHAGVSIATVSLVANGKASGRVSAATRSRVEASIDELGYVVNHAARSLVTGRHGRIALLANDMTNPFIASIATGVSEVLGEDMQLILAAPGGEAKPPDPSIIASFGVDGMLIDLADVPADFAGPGKRVPLVVLDEPDASHGLSRAYFDFTTGAAELGIHLAELGHRVIAYVDSNRPRTSFETRRMHLGDALKARAKGRTRIVRARSAIDISAARDMTARSMDQWLEQGVTAVVTSTDLQAYGVLTELNERGISVPDEMSVASFDNNAFSAVTNPSLTTVDLPAAELGRQAARLLVEQITRGAKPGRAVILPTSLTIRMSTGRASS